MAMYQKGLNEVLDDTFNKYKGKKVTVLHSGGLDSNVLIAGLYLAGADVNAVSIRASVLASSGIEERTRKLFINRLTAFTPGDHRIEAPTVNISGNIPGIHRNRFSQMAVWLNMMPLVSREDDDYVLLGYVMSDQGNSMMNELKKTWRTHKPYLGWNRKLPELEFPIAKFAKSELIKYFQYKSKQCNVDENLIHAHWFCELNQGNLLERCGTRCESCKRAKNENIFDWDIASNVNLLFPNKVELMDFLDYRPDEYRFRYVIREDKRMEVYLQNIEDKTRRIVYTLPKNKYSFYKHPEDIVLPGNTSPYDHDMFARTNQFPLPDHFEEYYIDSVETIKAKEVERERSSS